MAYLIVFDLDGTLIDSRLDLAESANELLRSYAAASLPVDMVAGMVGDGARVLVQRVLEAARLSPDLDDALGRFLEIYDRHLLVHTHLYPGVARAVDTVGSRAALAVLTNKPVHHTERLLNALGLRDAFRWVIGGDSAFPRKPDPTGLEHLMLLADAGRDETLMVGDSMVDLETGRRAGVRRCAVRYGFAQFRDGLVFDGSELVAETPDELEPRLIEFLAARPS